MDSMVGYKNEKYQYFGTAAAKLDDVVNFLPARISAWLMTAASALLNMDAKQAKKIFLRDRFKHSSPNSAQTESVMAGALNIQLAGNAWYFGTLHEKPTIGDPIRAVEPQDIVRANRLLYMTAILAVVLCGIVRAASFMDHRRCRMREQIHGGDVYRHPGVLDFSSNMNPLGTPDAVLKAAQEGVGKIENYPDVRQSRLKSRLICL